MTTTQQPPFPGIYRKHHRTWPWIAAVLVVIIAAAGALVASKVITDRRAGPPRQGVQSRILADSTKEVSGVRSVTCVMPATWASGQTFTCYAYGSSGRELAQVNNTVLPTVNGVDQWNETWITG